MFNKLIVLLSFLSLVVLYSCTCDPDECADKQCESHKTCIVVDKVGICVLKADMCDVAEDCKDANKECNSKHECVDKEVTCNPACKDWEECTAENTCTLKEGKCNVKEDCNDNKECDNHECVDKEFSCNPACKDWEKCEIVNKVATCVLEPNRCNEEKDCMGVSDEIKCDQNLHLCRNHACDDGSKFGCKMSEPDCKDGKVLVVKNTCYACVYPDSCSSCGDGKPLDVYLEKPNCNENTEPALYNGAWTCVDKECNKECNAVSDCMDKEWTIRGQGHWECDEYASCNQIVSDSCGNSVCDSNIGETGGSCTADCGCEKPKDCSQKMLWSVYGQGYWKCEEGNCIEFVESESDKCGNGICDSGEDVNSCESDCNKCTKDDICDRVFENHTNCAADCQCDRVADCMDNNWEGQASGHWTCYFAAGYCVEIADDVNCGNHVCDSELGETAQSCSVDCTN